MGKTGILLRMETIEISVKFNHRVLTYELPPDMDIWEMGEVFRMVLLFLTYPLDLINELLSEGK